MHFDWFWHILMYLSVLVSINIKLIFFRLYVQCTNTYTLAYIQQISCIIWHYFITFPLNWCCSFKIITNHLKLNRIQEELWWLQTTQKKSNETKMVKHFDIFYRPLLLISILLSIETYQLKEYEAHLRIIQLCEPTYQGEISRQNFLKLGHFGQLIDRSSATMKFMHDPLSFFEAKSDDFYFTAYDFEEEQWKQVYKYEIPKTYSLLPVPTNKHMELDYFIRTVFLVNHVTIWATNRIPRDTFGKLMSVTNKMNVGRFTMAPWLPRLKNLTREGKDDFIEHNEKWYLLLLINFD